MCKECRRKKVEEEQLCGAREITIEITESEGEYDCE
jgi:hypothetical protein